MYQYKQSSYLIRFNLKKLNALRYSLKSKISSVIDI